jgi:hypothetical protein
MDGPKLLFLATLHCSAIHTVLFRSAPDQEAVDRGRDRFGGEAFQAAKGHGKSELNHPDPFLVGSGLVLAGRGAAGTVFGGCSRAAGSGCGGENAGLTAREKRVFGRGCGCAAPSRRRANPRALATDRECVN